MGFAKVSILNLKSNMSGVVQKNDSGDSQPRRVGRGIVPMKRRLFARIQTEREAG